LEQRRSAPASKTRFMVLRLGQERAGTDKHQYLLGRLGPAARWLAQELDVIGLPRT
jgi:hypothetical protein